MSRQKPQWTQSSITDCSGARWASNAGISDAAHEQAGITGAGGVKAGLDPAHELQRRPSAPRPTDPALAAARLRARRARSPRRPPAASDRSAAEPRRGRARRSSCPAPRGRPACPRRRRRRAAPRPSSLGAAATRTSACSADRWPARWRSHSWSSSSVDLDLGQPQVGHQPRRPAAARRERLGAGAAGQQAAAARSPGDVERLELQRRGRERDRGAPSRSGSVARAERGDVGVGQRVQADVDREDQPERAERRRRTAWPGHSRPRS